MAKNQHTTVLSVTRLAFAYHAGVTLFGGVSFVLQPGWTGLVGPNGAGKSTLLRLLARELAPTEGHVRAEPLSARFAVCTQSVEQLCPLIRRLEGATDPDAHRLRGRLHLDEAPLARFALLSPGERRRWQVAAALYSRPDVLLLDEPTNHLDAESRRWLLRALREHTGVGVVVSHDRELLDALTHTTLRVNEGDVTIFPGGYTHARAAWEAQRQGRIEEQSVRQRERERQRHELAQRRRDEEAATRQRSAGRRMKDRHDSDARGALANGRAERAAATLGKRVAATRRQVTRADVALASVDIERSLGASVFVGFEPSKRPRVLEHLGPLRLPDGRLLPAVPFVGRDDRIWLSGPNGAGKSSLVAALLAAAPHTGDDSVLYLPQNVSAAQERQVLHELRRLPAASQGRLLSIVAALGADPARVLASQQPSPGEARKLLLARGLSEQRALLVLDEPENHLDLPSIERLQAALCAYPGALLLVSHDELFARACTRTRWALEERSAGKWEVRVGGLGGADTVR